MIPDPDSDPVKSGIVTPLQFTTVLSPIVYFMLNHILRVNGEQSNSETIVSKLDTEGSSAMEVDCVAAGARPEPSFKWYIGGEEIKVRMNEILLWRDKS